MRRRQPVKLLPIDGTASGPPYWLPILHPRMPTEDVRRRSGTTAPITSEFDICPESAARRNLTAGARDRHSQSNGRRADACGLVGCAAETGAGAGGDRAG